MVAQPKFLDSNISADTSPILAVRAPLPIAKFSLLSVAFALPCTVMADSITTCLQLMAPTNTDPHILKKCYERINKDDSIRHQHGVVKNVNSGAENSFRYVYRRSSRRRSRANSPFLAWVTTLLTLTLRLCRMILWCSRYLNVIWIV